MWSTREALQFCWELERALGGSHHVALTGSVLFCGYSEHDLDVVVYPHSTAQPSPKAVQRAMKEIGYVRKFDSAFVAKMWRRKGSKDEKHVEGWTKEGRRVDLFLLR